MHIRWSAPVDHALPALFVSRLPAGLHVFFTPLKAGSEVNLCPLLQQLFGPELKCSSTTESFTRPSQLSETFSSSASYQYFQVLPSLVHFNDYLQTNGWKTDLKAKLACENEAEFATYAASLDVDYDAISHAVSLSAAWSADADALVQRPGSGITDRTVVKFREDHRVEVGILAPEKADEVEELKLGGYLAVLGENDKPSMLLPACTIGEIEANCLFQARHSSPSPPATTLSHPPKHSNPSQQPSNTQPASTQNSTSHSPSAP